MAINMDKESNEQFPLHIPENASLEQLKDFGFETVGTFNFQNKNNGELDVIDDKDNKNFQEMVDKVRNPE